MMKLMLVFTMVFERDTNEYWGSGNDNNNYNIIKEREVFIQQLR